MITSQARERDLVTDRELCHILARYSDTGRYLCNRPVSYSPIVTHMAGPPVTRLRPATLRLPVSRLFWLGITHPTDNRGTPRAGASDDASPPTDAVDLPNAHTPHAHQIIQMRQAGSGKGFTSHVIST